MTAQRSNSEHKLEKLKRADSRVGQTMSLALTTPSGALPPAALQRAMLIDAASAASRSVHMPKPQPERNMQLRRNQRTGITITRSARAESTRSVVYV